MTTNWTKDILDFIRGLICFVTIEKIINQWRSYAQQPVMLCKFNTTKA